MSVEGSAVVLVARVAQARADLARVRRLLADATPADATHQAVRDRFQILAGRVIGDLDDIAQQATRRGVTPELWSRLATERTQMSRISREALAFIQGILMRASGLDDGVGEVTDRMLAGLTRRSGVDRSVVVAADDREFLDHTVSMVRLRFPDTTVWGLPILAHELGHHVAAALPDADPQLRLRGAQPVSGYVSRAAHDETATVGGDRTHVGAWLEELFADVFATYALGPAYPLAVLMLRAAPDRYVDATATHPSWRRRVLTMVAALAAMADSAADPGTATAFRLMARERVLPVWRLLGGDDAPDDEPHRRLRRQAAEMVELLVRNAPDRLRYSPSAPIERLVALLDGVAANPRWQAGAPLDLPAGTDVAHVLNAAWRWRLTHGDGSPAVTDRVSRAALQCCRVAEA